LIIEKEIVDYDRFGTLLGERKEKIERSNKMVTFDEERHFKNKPNWIVSLYEKIDEFCTGLKGKKIILKTYIKWEIRGKMFCRVFFALTSLKVYLRLRYSELEDLPKFCRDYSPMARFTCLEAWITEEYIENEEAFFSIISSLIQKSFERTTRAKRIKIVRRKELKPVKPTEEVFRPSLNLIADGNGFIDVHFKLKKSQKELLNRILSETILK